MQAGFKVATHKEGYRWYSSWTASWNGSSKDASSSGRSAGTCLKLQWKIPTFTFKWGRAQSWCTAGVRILLNHTSYILRVSYTARCSITHLSLGSCYYLPFSYRLFALFCGPERMRVFEMSFTTSASRPNVYCLRFFGTSKPLRKWTLGQYWSDC